MCGGEYGGQVNLMKDNISNIAAKKEDKILKQAIYDLGQWYDNLLDQEINMTTIVGILELTKVHLIEETWESLEDD
tara:strand:+ start:70 stop:297 length:228 start_codon:yes stop_codon:yes gene_type:complete